MRAIKDFTRVCKNYNFEQTGMLYDSTAIRRNGWYFHIVTCVLLRIVTNVSLTTSHSLVDVNNNLYYKYIRSVQNKIIYFQYLFLFHTFSMHECTDAFIKWMLYLICIMYYVYVFVTRYNSTSEYAFNDDRSLPYGCYEYKIFCHLIKKTLRIIIMYTEEV